MVVCSIVDIPYNIFYHVITWFILSENRKMIV